MHGLNLSKIPSALHRAYQSTLGREVAIKVILPHFANHPDFIRRFDAEARFIARLEHRCIVPLYDYWRDPNGAYLVMRWIRGGNLADALAKGAFAIDAAARLLDQVTAALDLAHRNNIIHRDIKPANILLDEAGEAYLSDFNIAKDTLIPEKTDAESGILLGSPDYMSPEQGRHEPVSPRSDIYSLGVVLYETLTGEHPFPNLSHIERLYKHLGDPLPQLDTLPDSGTHSMLDNINRVIQTATAKNPAERYASALALANAFRQATALSDTQVGETLVEQLTMREQEILQLIIDGCTNNEIARSLYITVSTVKWYIRQLYRKLGVRSRVQAVVRARDLDLIVNGTDESDPSPTSASYIPHPEPENPYKGLHAFEATDVRDFFGREQLTQKLIVRLQQVGKYARFLAVIGPSGSGKSSVVKAGLIPALWRGDLPGSEHWFVVEMEPGERPTDELEVALMRIAADQSINIHAQLTRDVHGLARVAGLLLPDDNSELVIIIDQFEEVFTLVDDEARRAHFLALLYAAVTAAHSRMRVVITLRADFYDRPLHYPNFGELVRNRMETILPLSADELDAAIVKPAERVGVSFEDGLVTTIAADVHYQAGALPLLQYALTELFEQRDNGTLTAAAYAELGGAVGALAKRADDMYYEQDTHGREAIRQMFLRLVTLSEGTEVTRRRVMRRELLEAAANDDLMDEIIDTCAAYRLLTLDHDPATRRPTVEIAHEAILRQWIRLDTWLDESRYDIRQQRLLATAVREWQQHGRDSSYLLLGSRLEQFSAWAMETDVALTPDERAFLDTSIAAQQQQQETERERQEHELKLAQQAANAARAAELSQRRSANRLRYLVAAMSIFLVVAAFLTGFAIISRRETEDVLTIAEKERDNARELSLVNGSQAALATGDLDTAIALALAANQDQNPSAQAQRALSAAAYTPGTVQVLEGFHPGGVGTVDISPDGKRLLAAPYVGGIYLYDIVTGEPIRILQGHENRLYSAFFSPDGRYAVSAAGDRAVIIWDLETGEIVRRLTGDAIESWFVIARFSPDGRSVISTNGRAAAAGRLIEWNIETGDIIRTFAEEAEGTTWFDFSPDGTLVATGSAGTVTLWDLASGEQLVVLGADGTGHNGPVTGIAFNSDGRRLLTGSYDRTMILWDLETQTIIRRFELPTPRGEGYDPPWMTVAFSADGSRVMANAVNTPLMVWGTETGRLLGSYDAGWHTLAPHPSKHTVLADIGFRLGWIDVEHGAELQSFPAAGGMVYDLSSDGRHVVARVDQPDNGLSRLVLYDVKTGQVLRRFDAVPIDEATAVVEFSPDGRYVLWPSIIESNRVIVWDTATGSQLQTLDLLVSSAREYVAFNPDGRTFWAALYLDSATTFVLVDLATGDVVRRFGGIHNQWINDLAVSSDGRMLLTAANDGTIGLWDIHNSRLARQYRTDAGADFITFMPDNSAFVASAGDDLVLLDIATGNERQRFIGHSGACCTSIAISSDGRLLVSSNPDDTFVWDIETGQAIRRYPGSAGWGNVHFGAHDRSVFVPGADEIMRQYRLDSLDELLVWTLDNRHVRDLTCMEREQYQIEPLCDTSGSYPTSTPYLTAEPTVTSPVPSPTEPPPGTATPTVTAMPDLVAQVGSQRGEIAIGQVQVWLYEGQAGEKLTIRANADQPATRSDAASTPERGGLDTRLSVIDPNGILMTGGREAWPNIDDIEAGVNSNSLIQGLELPLTGTYQILVTSTDFQTSGSYTLTIEARPVESTSTGLEETTTE